jgi:hypothetical protein
LGKRLVRCELDFSASGQRPAAGSCNISNEPLNSIQGRKFTDWLSYYLLLKDTALWSLFMNYRKITVADFSFVTVMYVLVPSFTSKPIL